MEAIYWLKTTNENWLAVGLVWFDSFDATSPTVEIRNSHDLSTPNRICRSVTTMPTEASDPIMPG